MCPCRHPKKYELESEEAIRLSDKSSSGNEDRMSHPGKTTVVSTHEMRLFQIEIWVRMSTVKSTKVHGYSL